MGKNNGKETTWKEILAVVAFIILMSLAVVLCSLAMIKLCCPNQPVFTTAFANAFSKTGLVIDSIICFFVVLVIMTMTGVFDRFERLMNGNSRTKIAIAGCFHILWRTVITSLFLIFFIGLCFIIWGLANSQSCAEFILGFMTLPIPTIMLGMAFVSSLIQLVYCTAQWVAKFIDPSNEIVPF